MTDKQYADRIRAAAHALNKAILDAGVTIRTAEKDLASAISDAKTSGLIVRSEDHFEDGETHLPNTRSGFIVSRVVEV